MRNLDWKINKGKSEKKEKKEEKHIRPNILWNMWMLKLGNKDISIIETIGRIESCRSGDLWISCFEEK